MKLSERYDGDAYRCVYAARFEKAVYVLHAFQKKSKSGIATPKKDIDVVYRRLTNAKADYVKNEMNKKIEDDSVYVSCGNVFEDLGLPNADEMLAKAEISLAIRRRIEELKLTQTAAATILETDQAKVSEIVNGRLRTYTLDRLLRYAKLLGIDVKMSLKTTRKRPGKMLVETIK